MKIIETHNCVQNCNTFDFFNGICKLNYINSDLEDNIIKNIQNDINNINNSLINNIINSEGQTFKISNNIYQISTIESQNKKENINISTGKFGECEDELRNNYNISKNISLLIFKIDIFVEGYSIPKIQYEIYNSEIKTN